jgi:hypothetical protein
LPQPHEVALAVVEACGNTHLADPQLLADGVSAVLLDGDQGRIDIVHCRVMTGVFTCASRSIIPPPMQPGSLGMPWWLTGPVDTML